MKNIIIVFAVMLSYLCVNAAYTGNLISPQTHKDYGSNVWAVPVGDLTLTNDSIDAGGSNVWGPFGLAQNKYRPQATAMVFWAPNGAITSGDSILIQYQISPTGNIADTIAANWTDWTDTITTLGLRLNYVTLDSLPAHSVFLKIKNVDSTGTRFVKKMYLYFIEKMQSFVPNK